MYRYSTSFLSYVWWCQVYWSLSIRSCSCSLNLAKKTKLLLEFIQAAVSWQMRPLEFWTSNRYLSDIEHVEIDNISWCWFYHHHIHHHCHHWHLFHRWLHYHPQVWPQWYLCHWTCGSSFLRMTRCPSSSDRNFVLFTLWWKSSSSSSSLSSWSLLLS